MKIFKLVAMITALLTLTVPVAYSGGAVQGTVVFAADDGTIFSGDWLRILLVREAIEVPALTDLEALEASERLEAIRTAHVDFYIQARSKLAEDGFIVATQMTTPEGTFAFENVYSGDYFILVTFPAMIRTYKVAWQIPITIEDGQTVSVQLNNENMVLPTYSR